MRSKAARSESARLGWETRWSNGQNVGEKGRAYLDKVSKEEAEYEYEYEGPAWLEEWEWDY